MTLDLNQAAADIAADREEIIERLVQFSATDMLLFWGNEKALIERQSKVWQPIIKWVNDNMESHFKATQSLDVKENEEDGAKVREFLHSLSDKELAAFYAAALATRSLWLKEKLMPSRHLRRLIWKSFGRPKIGARLKKPKKAAPNAKKKLPILLLF